MIVFLLLFLLVGVALGVLSGERTVRVLRTELNSAKAHEQLLLTRLASRTPAEYHAAVAMEHPQPAPVDKNRYLHDDTGLVEVVVTPEDDA